ncbi:hypothetical protein LZ32DRAFT_319859 [Colletotrichum eremochloae]|nr:hypothetical protein LZ32DRAFT_319859 [Colletotrichum eremochloae]
MELKGIDNNERAGRRKLRGYPAGPQSSNCNVVVNRAQRKVDEYREKTALWTPFGDNGDLGGVGVGSNTAAAQLLGGWLAEELQSLWGMGDSKGNKQKKRQTRTSGQIRSISSVGKGKGRKTSGMARLLVLRMSRPPAPLARRAALVGTNEENAGHSRRMLGKRQSRAWHGSVARRLVMGGERQGSK